MQGKQTLFIMPNTENLHFKESVKIIHKAEKKKIDITFNS